MLTQFLGEDVNVLTSAGDVWIAERELQIMKEPFDDVRW